MWKLLQFIFDKCENIAKIYICKSENIDTIYIC